MSTLLPSYDTWKTTEPRTSVSYRASARARLSLHVAELGHEFDFAGRVRSHDEIDAYIREDLGDWLFDLMIDLNQKLEQVGVKGVVELEEIEEQEVLSATYEPV